MIGACWAILGIEPTESPSDVKKAYARKLRETRPEDDPAAFQALHEAYREALWLVKHGLGRQAPIVESAPPPEELPPRMHAFADDHYEIGEIEYRIDTPAAPASPGLTEEQEALQDEMMKQLDELFSTPTQLCVPTRWEFITAAPDLLDDTFRVLLGRKVLRAIVEHHDLPGIRKRQTLQVTPLVLGKLDNVFFWTSEPHQFIDNEVADGAWELLSDIDPGKARYEGRPVGGEFIVGSGRTGKKPKRSEARKAVDINWWQIWVIFWLISFAIRSCAS